MKKMLLALASLAIFSGCERIEGQLNVTKDVQLVDSRGNKETVRVGTYTADIKANTKKKITLRLNNSADEKYVFNLPDGSRIPSNGSFSFSAKEVGQPVNLQGSVATTSSNSAERETWESCTYETYESVCFPLPNGGVTCTNQPRTVYGQQWIRYYDRTTVKDILLSIVSPATSEVVGDFDGGITYIDRIVTRRSICR